MEARDLGPIVRRELPRELIRKRYRGWAAIPAGTAQWAECELFAKAGWDWMDARVTLGNVPPQSPDRPANEPQTMSFEFTHAGRGINGSVDVVVSPNGFVQTADASGAEITLRKAEQFVASVYTSDSGDFFEQLE